MSDKISPIVFFSISSSGKEMAEAIKNYSENINHLVYSRFVRFVSFNEDGTLTNNVNDKRIEFSFPGEQNIKQDNFAIINKHRQEYLSIFEEVIGDINNLENTNFARENNFETGRIQIIILSGIDETNLMPLSAPLLLGMDSANLKFHFLILYNASLSNDKTINSKILKNAFFREIESIGIDSPEVWLLDIVNDEDFNVKDKSNLFNIASHFVDLLITDEDKIDIVNYSKRANAQGKLCRYSSIGYSVLKYPVEKAKIYMSLFGYTKEFKNLIEKFDHKFEAILLKDELTKFLTRKGFYETPERISKKENSDQIFIPLSLRLNLELENEKVLSRNLSLIENTSSLSATLTSELFREIDEAEKDYINQIFIEYSGHINSARDRELSKYLNDIREVQENFIDDRERSINYAILFAATLGNNQSVVEEMLEGRFSEDIPTLNSVEDKYRERFIGDEISNINREIERETLNSSNKSKLIEQYLHKLEEDRSSLKIIQAADEDNPKLAELQTSIVNYDKQCKILGAEVQQHNRNISRLISKADKIKIEFDRDATKESYKKERNENILRENEDIREKQLTALDKRLAEKYAEKNLALRTRKKHINYNLLIIPGALIAVSLLLQLGLYNIFDGYKVEGLKIGAGISILVIMIYYGISLFKFYQLSRNFKNLLGEISDLLHRKTNLFQKYLSNKNLVFRNDFEFEVDLISLSMVRKLKDGVSELRKNVENFKGRLIKEFESYGNEMKAFKFVENSFELGVLERADLEEIYKNYSGKALFYKTAENKLSKYYSQFIETGNLRAIEELIEHKVADVCSRKIENESLKTILFNETKDFGEINTAAKIKILLKSSRPLLRTAESHYPNIEIDIPYTENVIIGNYDQKCQPYWDDSQLTFSNSVRINETNENILGVLSIKSNFPSFLIYDVKENEEVIRNEVGLDDKKKYFINDTAFEYQLMPSNKMANPDAEDLMGDELITALSNKIVKFDRKNRKFYHPIIGDLGFKFEDLIKYWNSPICHEINKKAKEVNSDIWKYEEDEMTDYLNQFQRFWVQFGGVIPRNYEMRLSEYFLQRNGKEENWNEIKVSIKENRKKPMNSTTMK